MSPTNDHLPATTRADGRHDGRNGGTLSDRVRSLRLGDRPAENRTYGGFLPWAIAAALALTTVVFGVKALRAPGVEVTTTEAKAPEAPASGGNRPAAGAASSEGAGEVSHEAQGYVVAAHQIQISPQVGGEIVWLDPNFKEGAVYKKGDRLAEIDPIIYKAQLKSAEAALRVAETNLRQVETGSTLNEIAVSKAQVRNLAARVELSRIDERNKRLAGLGTSRDEMEKAIVQVNVDQAACEAQKEALVKLQTALEEQRLVARAQVQKAQADLEQAQKQLKNCTITAPTTGIILSKKAELGGYVNPLAFGAAGYLCEMADLRDLEIDLSIQQRDIDKVMDSRDCTVRPQAFADSDGFKKKHPDGYRGRVSRIMPVADRSKGSIAVRVAIDPEQIPPDEAGLYLKPDMSVLVWFKKAK